MAHASQERTHGLTPRGKEKAMTMVRTPQGALKLNTPTAGIPALRLLLWHAPEQRVELTDERGGIHHLPLKDIDLSHDGIAKLNAARPSFTPETTGVHPVVPVALAR